uniref:uncharacterized protein LOC120337104 n=1 Tax=Styela clava TaxID=7725 RepID=UPI001939C8C4|nr:uncharacterized protein LOC120337104 [Styela clava]
MDRRPYTSWSSSSTSKYVPKSSSTGRQSSKSPTRDRKRTHEDAGLANMRDIDFETKRKEIDLEIQRQEKEHKRKLDAPHHSQYERDESIIQEQKRKDDEKKKASNAETKVVADIHALGQHSGTSKDDLRNMLEKTRTYSSLTPPPAPPQLTNLVISTVSSVAPVNNAPAVFMQSSYGTTVSSGAQKIPGFDYSRLGSQPATDVNRSKPTSSNNDLSERSREARVKNFTKDCDVVAVVTQLLLREDPSLEGPLIAAMKSVLQKIMQKHLDVIKK